MEQKKRVLHIAEAFGGGIVEFLIYLTQIETVEHTILYAEREINIEVLKKKFRKDVKFVHWKNAQREISIIKDFKSYLFLKNYLKSNVFDVIHLHSSKAGIIGRLVKNKNYPTVIYTPNGSPFARKDISNFKRRTYQFFEYVASKFGGKVVGVSKSEANLYKSIGVNAIYINNGIKVSDYFPYNHNKKHFRIVTIGRITAQKDPEMFNEIALHFINDSAISFVWIGDGELKHLLTSKNISITGWLPKEDVSSELAQSDIYLSTAQWEGLPFAVLEAMNYALPLILHRCVGNSDLINNKNGVLFTDTVDAVKHLKELISDPNLIIQQGEASKLLLKQHFSLEGMIEAYEKLYQI